MACGKEMNLEEETPVKEMAYMLFVQENLFNDLKDRIIRLEVQVADLKFCMFSKKKRK